MRRRKDEAETVKFCIFGLGVQARLGSDRNGVQPRSYRLVLIVARLWRLSVEIVLVLLTRGSL